MTQIILGSSSPRRQEILGSFTLPFKSVTPPYDEELLSFDGDPVKYVLELASGKARSLQANYPKDIILSADTIVFKDGKIYGKPKNEEEAFKGLQELVGKWHSVFTGVAAMRDGLLYTDYEETKVLFHPLSSEEIRHYHRNMHWADKAGGYAIQMPSGLIVERIEGCYYNVVGLPINALHRVLLKVGINLWEYLK